MLNSKIFLLFPEIAASAPKCLKNPWSAEEDANQGAAKQEEPWPALADRALVTLVEQLFSHLLKVINICAHVMDDVAPGPAVKVYIKKPKLCDLNTVLLYVQTTTRPLHILDWIQVII